MRPEQYIDTVNSFLQLDILKRHHVVIAEAEEYLMDEVLSRMASKSHPRENRQERKELDLSITFVSNRTFVFEAPKLLIGSVVADNRGI